MPPLFDSGKSSHFKLQMVLDDSTVDLADLRRQFNDWPMPGLLEVIVVRGGRVIPFWP